MQMDVTEMVSQVAYFDDKGGIISQIYIFLLHFILNTTWITAIRWRFVIISLDLNHIVPWASTPEKIHDNNNQNNKYH